MSKSAMDKLLDVIEDMNNLIGVHEERIYELERMVVVLGEQTHE